MAENKKNDTIKEKKEDLVRVLIPRTSPDQEDKVVWVNDSRFVIQRGVEVDVPRCVAEVLTHESAMLRKAYDYAHKKMSA